MSNSIELSPKYGLNPTIPSCFWCGKLKNEIALMGRIRKVSEEHTAFGTTHKRRTGDYEAPKGAVLDYEPCDECKEHMSQGVTLMEGVTTPFPDGRPKMRENPDVYPTGRYMVITVSGANHIFQNVKETPFEAGDKLFLDEPVFEHIRNALSPET